MNDCLIQNPAYWTNLFFLIDIRLYPMSNPENLIETTLTSTSLFNGMFMRLMHDTVKLPDGATGVREYILHGGAVAIIAITDNNNIVLERQYRHPVGQIMLEIPAGKLEKAEIELKAAQRELKEETGYSSNRWIRLGHCLPCIGYSSEKIIYYLAQDVTPGQTMLDSGEFVETFTLPFNEFVDMAYNGEITDSKTLAGLVLYLGYLHKNSK